MSRQIELVLSSIPVDFLLETYSKISLSYEELPRSIKKLNFYVSVFYQDNQLRSRSVSCTKEEDNIKDEEIAKDHLEMLDSLKDSTSYMSECSSCNRNESFGLKIGHTVFVVKSHDQKAAELFCYILATNFVALKSLLLIKEWGQLPDLIKFSSDKNHYAWQYMNNVQKIAFGQLGGHR